MKNPESDLCFAMLLSFTSTRLMGEHPFDAIALQNTEYFYKAKKHIVTIHKEWKQNNSKKKCNLQ